MQKIVINLWFDGRVEEAMEFYASVFPDFRQIRLTRYTESGFGRPGDVMTADFEIFGQRFTIINGGPHFKLTEAASLLINCTDQEEVDYYWDRLTAGGGKPGQCGWLIDPFGVSWQVVPAGMDRLFHGDAERTDRVMKTMLGMTRIDLRTLEAAFDGRTGN